LFATKRNQTVLTTIAAGISGGDFVCADFYLLSCIFKRELKAMRNDD
jgi:hypothetical protein